MAKNRIIEGATAVANHVDKEFPDDSDLAFDRAAGRSGIKAAREDARSRLRNKDVDLKHHRFVEFDSGNPTHAAAYHEFRVMPRLRTNSNKGED